MFRGLTALVATLAVTLALGACGGDDAPDIDGGLTPDELAAKLPEEGISQAVAVDVVAAKEAAGLASDLDPGTAGSSPSELRFAVSAFFAFQSLALRTENPVRSALDHSLITAYAAQPAIADDAVTLVSTSQDFEDIATSLENEGWERDGAVLSIDGNAAALGYTAVGAGEGFLVLGNEPGLVEAVASGEAEPSQSGEIEALQELDAPVTGAIVPDVDGLECVELVGFEDFVDGTATVYITVDGEAATERVSEQLKKDSASVGFSVASIEAGGDTTTIELEGRDEEGIANSPALLIAAGFDVNGALLYDCG